jgi:NAD(P)-dependent dehydrogenase (short-subunit alcohol dehydrogenase family)
LTLQGKVVVITGSTRGIGRSIAYACAHAGAQVVVSSRDRDAVDAAVEALQLTGAPVSGISADVSDYAQVEALRDHALSRFSRIDAWFNNAGISLGYEPLDEQSAIELDRLISVNLIGHVYGCRAILPYFRQHGGHLVNMCGRGYRGEATPHTAAYACTKTAIASLTRSLAEENRDVPNVSINAFVPGMVDTDFYVDIRVSPRLIATADNWRYALDAFGVPIDIVGRSAAELLSTEPGRMTGKIVSLLGPARMTRGMAKMAYYAMSGRIKRG